MTNSLTEIDVRNYMKIRKAHLTISGNTIIISGDNETGKTSFLQSIQDLFGGKEESPTMPVRRGAKEATIVGHLRCADGRILKATLTHTKDSRRLVITDEEGHPQASPQTILAAFWAQTSFDPSIFLVSKPADQVTMLKKMAGLDFTKLDFERVQKFTERTTVNREVDRLKVIAAAKPVYENTPEAEQSSASVLAEIKKANDHNDERAPLQQAVNDLTESIDDYTSAIGSADADIIEIKNEIERLQSKLRGKEQSRGELDTQRHNERCELTKAQGALAAFVAIDVAPLQAQLTGLEEANRKVRAKADRAQAMAAVRSKESEAENLTDRLQEIDDEKSAALQAAKFPIAGMSFDENGVTINGVPLDQESDMRKIAIGVEMAAAMNPTKPLMLVRHGNLFTPQNFHIIEEIAEKRNLTCIIEIPGTKVAGSKLIFEDGVGYTPEELPAAPAQAEGGAK